MTSVTMVYDRFFGKITEDMYLEWTEQDTHADCYNILVDAVSAFEFPRQSLDFDEEAFSSDLTSEEINILATLMVRAWLRRQVASIENIRMKYSGTDFKMTSQANLLSKLLNLLQENEKEDMHLQRLYKRRRTEDGKIVSNWSVFRPSAFQ